MPLQPVTSRISSSKNLQNKEQGVLGERIARVFLEQKGFHLVSQNFRTKFAEADLVMEKGQTLVLIEVKQRASWSFGTPEEAVGKAKLRKLHLLAEWLSSRYPNHNIQVDVIAVEGGKVAAHLQNIEFS
jgi:putative endonuclease